MKTQLPPADATLDEREAWPSPNDSTLDEHPPPTSATAGSAAANQNDERNPVDVLADEFSSRLRAGEAPSIDEYVRRAPQHEAAIRAVFPSIAMMEGVSRREHAERQVERRMNRLTLADGETLGDFRIVREIGRGGMGIVYEAEQQSLKRRVALKVLGPAVASSPRQLQRFQREAESAARLHHTNIVPVYGIGEEDGVHFYAMQFIDGAPLSRAIETLREGSAGDHPTHAPSGSGDPPPQRMESPTVLWNTDPVAREAPVAELVRVRSVGEPNRILTNSATNLSVEHFRLVARLGAQVADALEYAHQHGVLHRDIKPSNLMLDHAGDVWITDFGLVKLAEQEDLTGTGDLVGTLRYMAPEQLEGRAEQRSDIYGLGLTLFELLTLRPAFDGDQKTAYVKRLRDQDVPRPRTINGAIPRDLETIVLKATAAESSARYATSAALAEDLRRFLDDRPILARRATLLERLWRWSRRNPALATASGLALSLLIAIAGVEWNARRRVESALSDTDLARRRAEANVDLAVDAFDSILDNVTSRGVPRSLALDLPQAEQGLTRSSLSEADAELLHRLLGFYRQFATANANSTRLRERVAMADQRTGAILVRLGRLTEAEEALRRSLDGLQSLLETDPHQNKLLVMSAQIHNEIGELLLRRGQFRETFNAHLEALAVFLDQPDSVLSDPAVRYERARATDLFASIDIRSGTNQAPGGPGPDERGPSPDERGNGPPRRGPDDRRPPPDFDDRTPPRDDRGPRRERDDRGPPPDFGDRPPPPPPDDRGPRREFNDRQPPPDFGDRPPRRPDDRGPGPEPDRGPGREFDGEPRPLQNLDDRLLRAMPAAFRDSPDKLRSLATVLLDASNDLRALTQEFPDNTQYQFSLAQCLRHRLVHATSTGEAGVASDTFHEAVRLLEQLAERSPNEPKFLFELADTLTQASRAQSSTDAETSLDRAVSDAEQLATRFANVSEYQLLLGTALARRAAIQESRGAINEAADGLTQAIAILEPLGAKFPDQGVLQIPLARTRRQLADLLRATAGHGDAATTRLEESRTILLKAIADFEHYLSLTNTQSQFNHHTRTGLNNSLAETLMQLRQ